MRKIVKRLIGISTALALTLGSSPVWAQPDSSNATLQTPGTQRTLVLPQEADNSPVISLGTAVDPQTGEQVEGLAIIHKNEPARSGQARAKTVKCYGFLASGAKWKVVEPWVVNPANTRSLDGEFVFNNLTSDIAKWEDAADGTIGNGLSKDILGNGSQTGGTLAADTASPDGQNEVYFADVSTSGTIAVTIVWGIFSGPTFQRKLVEWDQVYDDQDYDWSSSGEAGKMDFENIATHELGHSKGLDDLYSLSCPEETMYGYAASGETKKRDLNSGDITGISQLYK